MLNKYQWVLVAITLFIPSLVLAGSKKKTKLIPASRNLLAFLLMIQYAEGTYGANAYRTLYGGGLLESFDTHPNQAITRWGITSTAAGAYQFLYSTWEILAKEIRLTDFKPVSQDRAAIEMIRKKGALSDVLQGNIADAIFKCRKIWASLPGAGYNQKEKNIEELLRFYIAAGGQLNTSS